MNETDASDWEAHGYSNDPGVRFGQLSCTNTYDAWVWCTQGETGLAEYLKKKESKRQAWDEHLRWAREWETRFWEAQERRGEL